MPVAVVSIRIIARLPESRHSKNRENSTRARSRHTECRTVKESSSAKHCMHSAELHPKASLRSSGAVKKSRQANSSTICTYLDRSRNYMTDTPSASNKKCARSPYHTTFNFGISTLRLLSFRFRMMNVNCLHSGSSMPWFMMVFERPS